MDSRAALQVAREDSLVDQEYDAIMRPPDFLPRLRYIERATSKSLDISERVDLAKQRFALDT